MLWQRRAERKVQRRQGAEHERLSKHLESEQNTIGVRKRDHEMKWIVRENTKREHRCASGECDDPSYERIRKKSMNKEAQCAHTTRTHDSCLPATPLHTLLFIHFTD
jgi:hypothetical protein